MASIPYRNNKWQARVIRKGYTPVARSFLTKLDAEDGLEVSRPRRIAVSLLKC